jgi:hypothetical protein
MKTVLQENNTLPQRRDPGFVAGDYGVFREEEFIEMLAFERKRSERSGKPFLLMKLTIFGISELPSRRDTMRVAAESLSVFGRETDIKGWYRSPSVLGVIFTETDNIDTKTLREKIYRRLRSHLNEAQVEAIQISFHTYPDDGDPAIPSISAGLTFYPAASKKNDPKMSPS